MANQIGERATRGAAGAMQRAESLPASVYYWTALGSIGLSGLLLLLGRKTAAVFVGLWPPTILMLGMFNKQLRPSGELAADSTTGNHPDMDPVDTMSADSFPASDPPAGPATLGPQREPNV